MNKIFKKVFNKSRGCFVAVSECSKSVSRAKSVVLAGAAGLALISSPCAADTVINYFSLDPTQPAEIKQFTTNERTATDTYSGPLNDITLTLASSSWTNKMVKTFLEGDGINLQNTILVDKVLCNPFGRDEGVYSLPFAMGFKGVSGYGIGRYITITGNSELTLIGEKNNTDYLITGYAEAPFSNLIIDKSATLYLGNTALPDADLYGGVAYLLSVEGSVHVVAGDYRISGRYTQRSSFNGASLKVYEGASLSLNGSDLSFFGESYIVNHGDLTIEDGGINPNRTFEHPGVVLKNYSKLNFHNTTQNDINKKGKVETVENNGVFNYYGPVNYISTINPKDDFTDFLNDVYTQFDVIKGTGILNIDGALAVDEINTPDGTGMNVNINSDGALKGTNLTIKNLVNNGTVLAKAQMTSYGSVDNIGSLYVVNSLSAYGRIDNKGLIYLNDELKLVETAHLHNAATGTINVPYRVLFTEKQPDSATLNTIGIAEKTETTVKPVKTSYFGEGKVSGKLLDIIKTHSSWDEGGNLVIRFGDQGISQAAWDGAVKDFQNIFGKGTTLSYEGTFAEDKFASDIFNIPALNTLYANEPNLQGVIYVDRSLTGEGNDVHVGASANSLNNSTGFMSVINAPKVWVEEGKELALIGAKFDDGTSRTTVAQNINVTGADAKLTLGSLGLKDATKYRTDLPELTLADQAHFSAVTGDHLVTNFESTNGSSFVAQGVKFRTENSVFNEESSFDNYGEASFGKLSGNFLTSVNNFGNMVVEGETKFSGQLNNDKYLQLKDNATFVGTLQNNENGEIYAKTVNVIGSLINNGYMEAQDNSTVNGRIDNPGTIILYSVDINKGDTDSNGVVQNSYKLIGTGAANINGYLKNVPGAVAIFNDADSIVNIKEGGTVSNSGIMLAKAGEIQGSLQTSDLAVLDKVKGTATSSVVAKGVLMAETFSTDGAVLMSKNTNLVIGGEASRTKFLLSNLHIAKRILDAGGEIPQVVKEALQNQGIEVASLEETPVEAPVKMVRKAARRAVAPVADESAVVEETTVPEAEAEAVAQAEVNEEKVPEEAPVVAVRQVPQPVQFVLPKLVPSVQGAVASMSIASVTQDTGFLEDKALSKGDGLWANVGTNRTEFNGYKGNRSGLFFGGQANVNDNVLVGATIRYTDGHIKGNGLDKQDWSSYGAGVYVSYTKDGWFALGTGTYQSNRAKKGGRVEANTFALSVKGGKTIDAGKFTVTPYVGYRMVHVDTDYADKATVHQIPVGVKIQGNTKVADWKFSPSVDAAFVPQIGDRKIGLKGTDLQSTIASRYATEAKVGFSATKGNFGVGLYYTGSAGDKGLRSHSIQAQINYAF